MAVHCVKASVGASVVATYPTALSNNEGIIESGIDIPFEYEICISRAGKGIKRLVLYISRNTKSFELQYKFTER